MTTQIEGPPQLTHKQILVVIGGLMAGMLLAALDQSIVGTALPRIVSELGGLDKLVLGRHRLPAHLDRRRPRCGARSPTSTAAGCIFQAAIVIFAGRLGAVRALAEHDAADRLPRVPGHRRRRPDVASRSPIIGDVIPPRERGRYQGYFGAVFGVVQRGRPAARRLVHRRPRLALDLLHQRADRHRRAGHHLARAASMPVVRREHAIDYLGAAADRRGASPRCCSTSTGPAPSYGWGDGRSRWRCSPRSSCSASLFVFVELRAAEPIIPMRLFRNPIFRVGNIFGFLIRHRDVRRRSSSCRSTCRRSRGCRPTQSGLAHAADGRRASSRTSITAGPADHAAPAATRSSRSSARPILIVALLAADAARRSTTPYWQVAVCRLRLRRRARPDDADDRHRRAERRRAARHGHGHQRGHVLPPDRRRDRRGGLRRDPLEPAGARTWRTSSAGRAPAGGAPSDANNVQAIQHLHRAGRERVLDAFSSALDDVFLLGVPIVILALVVALPEGDPAAHRAGPRPPLPRISAMARIPPVDETSAPPDSAELAAAHAATGGRMTNMKWTLAHSPVALDALLQWYPLHDAVAPLLGERRTWLTATRSPPRATA